MRAGETVSCNLSFLLVCLLCCSAVTRNTEPLPHYLGVPEMKNDQQWNTFLPHLPV